MHLDELPPRGDAPSPPDAPASASTEHAVLDALGAGVLGVCAEGVVRTANRHASMLLGRPLERLVGQPVGRVFAPLEVLESTSERAGHDGRRSVQVARGDGLTVSLGFTVGRPQSPHPTLRYVVLFQDLSGVDDLRRQRDRLLQLATLEDALPSVLHELRNPLAAVTASLECLTEETDGDLRLDLLATLSELRRMSLMLSALGGVARPVRTQQPCDAAEAVREACRVMEPTAWRKGVTLRAPEAVTGPLYIDRAALAGVVFNLVKNAIDACGAGDEVAVELELRDGALLLRVRDTGPGMPVDVRERATELFFTTKRRGSGIGLALCKQVAESGGGTLRIDSAPGAGTVVELRVPAATSPSERPAPG